MTTGAGALIAGRFEIEELAGAGGMGTVFRARDRSDGGRVALKIMRVRGLEEAQRFAREARMLEDLAHPTIVRHVASGATEEGEPFLAMEWLDGEDLDTRLARGPLSPADAVALVACVAGALGFVHARGAVHRDVKPSNIFLQGGAIDRVKLLDFGIARSEPGATRAVTRTGRILGTPGYMAPEQIASAKGIDARADVFALGCVLFECLTARPAFYAERVMDLLAMVALRDAPRLRELLPGAPADLDALVASMLAKSPARRPADGAAVAAALAALAPASGPPSVSTVMGDSERRRAYVVAASIEVPTRSASSIGTRLAVGSDGCSGAGDGDASIRSLAASFGATLEPLSGDAVALVIAGSGAAVDLAARAARCALALRRLAREAPIVVGTGYLTANRSVAAGEALDRAGARLRERARSDSRGAPIRLDAAISALLEGRFAVEGGVLAAEHRPERARRVAGRIAPLVGRSRELAMIQATWDECLDDGVARVVVLVAPCGQGKTRLLREAVEQVGERRRPEAIWMARGSPDTAGTPFALASALAAAASEPSGSWTDPDAALRARLSEAAGSVLIAIDDMQWADLPSLRGLDTLLARRRGPLLLLAAARPDVREQFPNLWTDRGPTQLSLPDLSDTAAAKLARGLLGADTAPETVEAVVRDGGGNPFLLEELCRARAAGMHDRAPDAALAVLQARLEGLSSAARRMIRAASALGPVFWRGGLARLLGCSTGADYDAVAPGWGLALDGTLAELVERQVVESGGSAGFLPAEQELLFRHPLLAEAVFETLTEADKALGRRLADEWLAGIGDTAPPP